MSNASNVIVKWYISENPIKRFFSLFLGHLYVLVFFSKENLSIGLKRLKAMKKLGLINNSTFVFIDMLICYFFFGYTPSTYASYCFQDVPWKRRLTFMPSFENALFALSFNLGGDIDIFVNKEKTYEYLKEFYGRNLITIREKKDLSLFLEFVNKHSSFFYKPLDGAFGINTGLAKTKEIDPVEFFNDLIGKGGFVIEELIIQCKELAAFHPSSVNSIRLNVIKTMHGTEILCGCFKCGQGGSVVDNGSAGGIFIPFNLENGRLLKNGFDENGNRVLKHPNSNIVFENYQLPRYSEIKELAIKALDSLPGLNYVGWDIAVTDDKPVIIEGNCKPGIQISEGLFKEGFRKDYRKMARTKIIPDDFRKKQNEVI